jgi:hypothetical protein
MQISHAAVSRQAQKDTAGHRVSCRSFGGLFAMIALALGTRE